MSERIRGVLAPVVTPFRADLSPDRERFIRHCQWLLSQNYGLTPFGTTSEAASMSQTSTSRWQLTVPVAMNRSRFRAALHEVLGNHRRQPQRKRVGVCAVSQRLILRGERSGLLTHTAATENVSLCTPTKS